MNEKEKKDVEFVIEMNSGPETMEDKIYLIECALIDPKSPLYGSDIVSWVADLIEERNLLKEKLELYK